MNRVLVRHRGVWAVLMLMPKNTGGYMWPADAMLQLDFCFDLDTLILHKDRTGVDAEEIARLANLHERTHDVADFERRSALINGEPDTWLWTVGHTFHLEVRGASPPTAIAAYQNDQFRRQSLREREERKKREDEADASTLGVSARIK